MKGKFDIEQELLEQSRLLGMGAEREAKLLSQVDSLKREKDKLEEEVKTLKLMYNSLLDLKDALENKVKSLEKI